MLYEKQCIKDLENFMVKTTKKKHSAEADAYESRLKKPLKFLKSSVFATEKELYKDPNLTKEEKQMHDGLLFSFDAARRELNAPLLISSGRRSLAAQKHLVDSGKRAAKVSTHCFGAALDVRVPGYLKDFELAEIFKRKVLEHCGILPRLGYMSYRVEGKSSLWLHVDVGPIFFKEFPGEFPDKWGIEGLIF